MATTTRPITIHGALALAAIVETAVHGSRVAWLTGADGVAYGTGDVAYGTARSIGDESGNFARDDQDIRDCHLRITTDRGFEWFPPVADVLRWYADGLFVVDPTEG
jgi:hypothetical protein